MLRDEPLVANMLAAFAGLGTHVLHARAVLSCCGIRNWIRRFPMGGNLCVSLAKVSDQVAVCVT